MKKKRKDFYSEYDECIFESTTQIIFDNNKTPTEQMCGINCTCTSVHATH